MQNVLADSSEFDADTAVAFCLKCCLDSPVVIAAANMTISAAVSIWEWVRQPARYPEKDAFGG